jgi:exopolysaccharide biosynthesis polyprenyl glycosylphosphotransferase
MHIRNPRFYQVTQTVLDLLAVTAAWNCTIQTRVLLNPWAGRWVGRNQAPLWAPSLVVILVLWIVIAWRLRLHRSAGAIRLRNTVINAAEGAVLASGIIIIVTSFSRELGAGISRSFFLIFAPLAFVSLSIARYLWVLAASSAERRWPSPARAALLGTMEQAGRLFSTMRAGSAAIVVKGLILPEGHSTNGLSLPVPILGTTAQLGELINRERLNRIILLSGSIAHGELAACHRVFKRMSVILNCTVDLAHGPGRVNIVDQCGLPLVELRPITSTKSQELVKRGLDIVISILALILLGPAMLAIAVLVKLSSAGPVLYKAPRVGRGGRYFMFLKFRSMYTATHRSDLANANEKQGHIFKMRRDPRVTPIGRFIRRYSLDELPQLINVLRGEMSLVGPRPLPAGDLGPDGMSRQFAEWSEGRSAVYPGITGLWQVNGRSELSFEEMVSLDLEYIRDWSLLLDLKILLATPSFVVRGIGAY